MRALATLVIWLLLVLGAGCAHYQLGTGTRPAFRTLYVAPVESTALVPQAREVLSTQLREAFARDGRVALVNSPERADATLHVVIQGFQREIAAAREGDTGLASKFNVVLSADCTLRDNRAGRDLFTRRPLSATREVFTEGGQLQAEYQVLPLLAGALADRARHATLDTW